MTGLVVNTITALPETARLPFTHEALQLELDNLATSSNSSSAANAAAVAGTATILSASFVLDQRDRFRRGVCELVRAVCLDSLDTSHPVDSATTTTSALHIPPPSLLALASIDAFVTLNQQIQALRRTHPCHEHATRHSALVSLNSVSAYPGPITLLDPLALASFIIDALWLMDIETEGGNPALIDCDAVRGRLFSFAGALVKVYI